MFLEKRFVDLLGRNLDRFAWKKANLASCRCPVCGDSKKTTKVRFYFIEGENGRWNVYCHNCQYSSSFRNFLKQQNRNLYNEFVKDSIFEAKKYALDDSNSSQESVVQESSVFADFDLSLYAKRIDLLENDHPAKKYLTDRLIPDDKISLFWWSDHFKDLATNFNPFAYGENKFDNERIIIPFFSRDCKQIQCLQGRTIDPLNNLRYITLKSKEHEKHTKIFGLERVNFQKTHYVLEGPIDSVFLDNAVAVAGLKSSNDLKFQNSNTVFVLDNQPRKEEVISSLAKLIKQGSKVVIWPSSISEKDINEMILAGKSVQDITDILESNTFDGLSAFMKFSEWSKL